MPIVHQFIIYVLQLTCNGNKSKPPFIRRISVASNAIQTIDN